MRSHNGTVVSILLLAVSLPLRAAPGGSQPDLTKAALAGGNMAASGAARLEAELKEAPHAVDPRARLLGYYFIQRLSSDDAKRDRIAHVLWMIENQPAHELTATPYCQALVAFEADLYAQGKAAWAKHTGPEQPDARILGNAAAFFTLSDFKACADLLTRAAALDPKEPDWPRRLAHVHQLEAGRAEPDAAAKLRAQALAHQTKALGLSKAPNERFYLLTQMPKLALDAGRPDDAAAHAKSLLEMAETFRRDWNYGNAIHDANLALGHVALAKNDVAGAKEHLLAAGRTPGSPQLGSFGPSMSLAKALAEKGERDVVVKYLKLCGKFWKMGEKPLAAWTKTLESGGTPTFDKREVQ